LSEEESLKEAEEAETKVAPPSTAEVTPEERITIRSYPHITVQLYILGTLAIIFGIVEMFVDNPNVIKALGVVFILAYIFLAIVVAFEFPETKFFLLIAIIIILILLYVLFSFMGWIPSMGGLGYFYDRLDLSITDHAYLGIGLGSFVVLFLIWLSRRFNYWIVEPNQVLHKTGLFGKLERHPTRSMKFSVNISDVFEYLLFFKSGKLVFDFPSEKKTYVLTLVPNIKHVEKRLQEILGYVEVE